MSDDVVIVGGGLAGGAAAILLTRAGRHVDLLEREAAPVDRICGEFLSAGAHRSLAGLDIDLDQLGASAITRLRLTFGKRAIETSLPFVARGLSRKRLDSALLERAAAAGAHVVRGTTAREIGMGKVETTRGGQRPATLILASGKQEVRGALRDTRGCETGYVGFKMHWRLSAAARAQLTEVIAVVLFDGGYAGLQLIEGNKANLCLLIEKKRFAEIGASWESLLVKLLSEPEFERLLGDAEPLSPKPLTIAGVPYGFLDGGAANENIFRLGDQAAVIPSFCGEGMAIALRSATIGAGIIAAGGTPCDHGAAVRNEFRRRVRIAVLLQRAAKRDLSRELIWRTLSLWPAMAGQLAALTRVPQ